MMKATLHNQTAYFKSSAPLLLIVGDGQSAPGDLALFRSWGLPHDVGAIGRSIKLAGDHCTHWWNADGETAMAWAKQVKAQSKNGLVTHTLGPVDGFDFDWDMEQPDYRYQQITGEKGRIHGTSAMFATLTALAMGYGRIVLAGCPLDSEGHWYFEQSKETLGPLWLGFDFMAWIDFSRDPEAARVRSMSGYTAKILGEADRRWACEL